MPAMAESWDAQDASGYQALRPRIPLVLAAAVPLWAACAAAYLQSQGMEQAACVQGGMLLLVPGLAVAVFVLVRKRQVALCCVLLGLAFGGCMGFLGGAAVHAQGAALQRTVALATFTPLEDSRQAIGGETCLARAVTQEGTWGIVTLRLPKGESLLYGEPCTARVSFLPSSEASADYAWGKGACATVTLADVQRCQAGGLRGQLLALRGCAIAALAADGQVEGSLEAALVCGYRENLRDTETYQAFRTAGLAHLVAVSGAHLSLLCALTGAFLRLLRVPRKAAIVISLALLLAYLAVCAAPPSAVRALLMALLSLASVFGKRRNVSLNGLGLCVLAFLLLDPVASLSVSLLLSATSTLGIILFSTLMRSWFGRRPPLPQFALDALLLTLSSNLVSLPLSVALFSQCSLVAPLANMVVAPLFPLCCLAGVAAALSAGYLPAALPVALGAAKACGALLKGAVTLLAAIPYASVPVDIPLGVGLLISAALTVALYAWWPSRVRGTHLAGAAGVLAAGALLVGAIGGLGAGTQVIMLDVGQGDAFLVRSQGHTLLIDTGNHDDDLRRALARHGVASLDAVVISHADDDHCGSLPALKGVVQVGQVLLARDALACTCGNCQQLVRQAKDLVGEQRVVPASYGDQFSLGAVTCQVVWPHAFQDKGGNGDSLCLLAEFDIDHDQAVDWRALFVGDAESDQLDAMLEEGVGPVDLYKVGHHGSAHAITASQAQQLSPRISLVSVGAGNRYGHPVQSTLQALGDAGSAISRSDESGDVSCSLTAADLKVSGLR